jgi:hypothetical protein
LIVKGFADLLDMLLSKLIVSGGYPSLQRGLGQFVFKEQAIATMGWTVHPHAPYNPDLAPSSFHLFGPLKVAF